GMKKTQITLEDSQYGFMLSEAAEKGISASAYIRDLIKRAMAQKDEWDSSPFLNPNIKIVDTRGSKPKG
ncbi:MAG: hypothetical protein ACT4NX_07630, partial [Deltaproteobacteria bacterium]